MKLSPSGANETMPPVPNVASSAPGLLGTTRSSNTSGKPRHPLHSLRVRRFRPRVVPAAEVLEPDIGPSACSYPNRANGNYGALHEPGVTKRRASPASLPALPIVVG